MDRALTVLLGVIAGVVVVLGAVALVVTLTGDDDPEEARFAELEPSRFPPVTHDDAAARALVDAWSRWRTATFVSSGSWTRILDADPDAPLTGDVYSAQDPPRRFQVRLDGASSIDDPDDYQSTLVAEISLVGGYVIGDARLYDVADVGDGCFHAELIVAALGSPWGRWAEYCFDEATGALELARVRRQSAVDIERHDAIRADVGDSDFGSLVES